MNFILAYFIPKLKGFLPIVFKNLPWIALILAIWFGGFFYSKSHWQTPLLTQIATYQKAEKKLTDELKSIKQDAINDANSAKEKLDEKQKSLNDLQQKYQLEKNKAPKIVYKVKDPRPNTGDLTLEFDKKGNMVCNKFPDTYTDVLNKMIDEANKK